MTPEEKLINTHNKSLSAHYGENLKKMKFAAASIYEKDSAISISDSKKEAYISRHYVSGHYLGDHPTHVIILNGDCFDRI